MTDDKIQTYGRGSNCYKWRLRGTNSHYYRNSKNVRLRLIVANNYITSTAEITAYFYNPVRIYIIK